MIEKEQTYSEYQLKMSATLLYQVPDSGIEPGTLLDIYLKNIITVDDG